MALYSDYTASDGSLWHISADFPPIPWRGADWGWWHDDYDGAPDAYDDRHGSAATKELAMRDIEEKVLEMAEEAE